MAGGYRIGGQPGDAARAERADCLAHLLRKRSRHRRHRLGQGLALCMGSVLQVSAKGAPAGITCRLQAVGPGGARADGASWRAGEYPPGTTIPGAVAMSPGAIEHFEIVAGNGQKLVTMQA